MQTEIVADGGSKNAEKANDIKEPKPRHPAQPKRHSLRHPCKALVDYQEAAIIA
jgi:hypothetical protein